MSSEHKIRAGGCGEYAELSRRGFLGVTASAAGAMGLSPSLAMGGARGGSGRDVLVVVYARGGMDGLTAVVPYGDSALYSARPNLAVPPPGQRDGAIDLDGLFGLPQSLAPLMAPYSAGDLLFVHAAGSPDPTLSHFSAQYYMESATPNMPHSGVNTGWIGRHLSTVSPLGDGLFRGVGWSPMVALGLVGAGGVLSIEDPSEFVFPGDAATEALRRKLYLDMYRETVEPLKGAAASSFPTVDLLASVDFLNYTPANDASYPASPFGEQLAYTAAAIKADIGLEVAQIDIQSWDTHAEMGPVDGILATKLDDLGRGLEAFWRDLGGDLDRVTLVVMTEFGRRVEENDSGGTDHGNGGCMFVMGGHIAGGRVLTDWPGLESSSLGNGNLPVTIDYRDVLAELLEVRLGSPSAQDVFLGYQPTNRGVTI